MSFGCLLLNFSKHVQTWDCGRSDQRKRGFDRVIKFWVEFLFFFAYDFVWEFVAGFEFCMVAPTLYSIFSFDKGRHLFIKRVGSK